MNNLLSVLRDTGSSTVIVHGKYVEPAKFTGEVRMISLAEGTVRECQEAWFDISTLYYRYRISFSFRIFICISHSRKFGKHFDTKTSRE